MLLFLGISPWRRFSLFTFQNALNRIKTFFGWSESSDEVKVLQQKKKPKRKASYASKYLAVIFAFALLEARTPHLGYRSYLACGVLATKNKRHDAKRAMPHIPRRAVLSC